MAGLLLTSTGIWKNWVTQPVEAAGHQESGGCSGAKRHVLLASSAHTYELIYAQGQAVLGEEALRCDKVKWDAMGSPCSLTIDLFYTHTSALRRRGSGGDRSHQKSPASWRTSMVESLQEHVPLSLSISLKTDVHSKPKSNSTSNSNIIIQKDEDKFNPGINSVVLDPYPPKQTKVYLGLLAVTFYLFYHRRFK